MRSLVRLAALAATLAMSVSAAAHDERHDSFGRARASAWKSYESGDYPAFVARMEPIAESSGESRDAYNLACGYALTGRGDEAVELLEDLVDRGADFDFVHDGDLASLRARPGFLNLVGRATYREAVSRHLEPVRARAMEKYEEGRYDVFVAMMEEIAHSGGEDEDLYNLACGYALLGQAEPALALLAELTARGASGQAASDGDFDAIRDDPRFQAALGFQ